MAPLCGPTALWGGRRSRTSVLASWVGSMGERMVLGRDNGMGRVARWEVLDGALALVD